MLWKCSGSGLCLGGLGVEDTPEDEPTTGTRGGQRGSGLSEDRLGIRRLNGKRGQGPVTAAAGHRFGFCTPESQRLPVCSYLSPGGRPAEEEWVGQR